MTVQQFEVASAHDLQNVLKQLRPAFDAAQNAASAIKCVHFVSIGSGYRGMQAVQFFSESISKKVPITAFISSRYELAPPATLGNETLVVLSSKKGTTPETLKAAEFVRGKAYSTITLTQFDTSPLAKHGDRLLALGETNESFLGIYMLLLAIAGGVWERAEEWKLGSELLSSLNAFPAAVVDAVAHRGDLASQNALRCVDWKDIYIIASGAGVINSEVFGPCILTESHKIPTHPIEAALVKHGVSEIFNKDTPIIIVHTEDDTRPLTERAEKFVRGEGFKNVLVYDGRNYQLNGVHPFIRPFLVPFAIQKDLKLMATELNKLRNVDLTDIRYTGKPDKKLLSP